MGYLSINATLDEMREAVSSQGVPVVELEELKQNHRRFKSFRLRIRKDHLSKVTEPEFWPEGVVVRRFFRGKEAKDDSNVNQQTS